MSGGPQYEVEAILGFRTIAGRRQYLVRWKGYSPDSDSWENEEDLSCPKTLQDYWHSNTKPWDLNDSPEARITFLGTEIHNGDIVYQVTFGYGDKHTVTAQYLLTHYNYEFLKYLA